MHDSEPDQDLHFGKVVVRPAARQLLVDARPVPVGARAFDVLLALVERRDRVVGKNELLEIVWPGLVVEENNLQVQVSALRKALGPDAIVTVPGRGYRFALGDGAGAAATAAAPPLSPAPLPALVPSPALPAARSLARPFRTIWGAAGGAAVALGVVALAALVAPGGPGTPAPGTLTAPLRSVVIAPFVVGHGDEALAAAAARLGPDVTRALANSLRHVQVVPHAPDGVPVPHADAAALGRAANVRFVVAGELRRIEGRVGLTLRVTDTHDASAVGRVVDSFDAERFADHEATVRRLVSRTRVMLSRAISNAVAVRGEEAADAQDLVDLAGAVTIRDLADNAREARRLADAAIGRDPKLARAWSARAGAGVTLFFTDFALDTEALTSQVDEDSFRAVTLDPWDGMSWLMRSYALRVRGNFEGAMAALDRAEELDPTVLSTLSARGWLQLDIGQPEQALKSAARLADALGQHDPLALRLVCVARLHMGDYEAAIASCERVEASFDVWVMHAALAAAHALRGDIAKAAEARERLLRVVPTFTISRYEARMAAATGPEARSQVRAHFTEGLRRAGVPE